MANNETCFEMEGEVVEKLRGGQFKVKMDDNGMIVNCTISGKLRTNSIRIIIGDKVTVAVSIDDVTKGRIIWRSK